MGRRRDERRAREQERLAFLDGPHLDLEQERGQPEPPPEERAPPARSEEK